MIKFVDLLIISALIVSMSFTSMAKAEDMSDNSEQVTVVAVATVVPGKLDELIDLVEELAAHTKETEPGMMGYRWYLNADKTEITVLETYENSAAVLFHGKNYQPFSERLDAVRTRTSLRIMGNLSPELEAAIEAGGVKGHTPFGGFVR